MKNELFDVSLSGETAVVFQYLVSQVPASKLLDFLHSGSKEALSALFDPLFQQSVDLDQIDLEALMDTIMHALSGRKSPQS